jgi:hypothetical protein
LSADQTKSMHVIEHGLMGLALICLLRNVSAIWTLVREARANFDILRLL